MSLLRFQIVPVLFALATSAAIHKIDPPVDGQFNFQPSSNGFLISGEFVKVDGSEGKEHWLCFDYSFDTKIINASGINNKPYPTTECEGPMTSAENAYWFAVKAKWHANGSVDVDFVNTLDLKVRSASFFEGQTVDPNKFRWKLALEAQSSAPSIVYFNGLGDVEVAPVGSQVHVRLPKNGFVKIEGISSPLNPVILDQVPKYHLLSEILKGDETVLKNL